MIYYLFLLLISAQVQECNWDYGIPNEHNKHTDGDVRRNLIVDGQASQPHEYPWQVSIEPIGCGGSIISREYILSAAHCVSGTPTVVAGLNRYRIRGTWIPHELYNDNNIENDIAVIKLDQPLPCDDPTINAIALPELLPGFSLDECTAWVTGFGALREDGPSPPGYSMHEVQTKVFSTDYCNAAPENIFTLPQTQICGFTPGKPTEDSCQGDSGGPFKIDMNSFYKSESFFHLFLRILKNKNTLVTQKHITSTSKLVLCHMVQGVVVLLEFIPTFQNTSNGSLEKFLRRVSNKFLPATKNHTTKESLTAKEGTADLKPLTVSQILQRGALSRAHHAAPIPTSSFPASQIREITSSPLKFVPNVVIVSKDRKTPS